VRYHLLVLCLLSIFAGTAQSQLPGQREPAGKLEIRKYPLQLEKPLPPAQVTIDPAKLRAEANELAELAQSVPAYVEQVTQGRLPKDFSDKLKRIEKLSKHLRGELTP
jgi:hypothetical protein